MEKAKVTRSPRLYKLNTEVQDNDFELSSDITNNDDTTNSFSFSSNLKYAIAGIVFGIIFVKSEIISWFRIQEMFRFQNFHMYGVIGSAVITGMLSIWIIKKFRVTTINGKPISFSKKHFHKGQIIGGLIFGFGWAMTGACPGPIFAQIGTGVPVVLIVLIGAVAGTWVYGFFSDRLPH